ncbi:MAG: FAD-dependent oxidoreductase [Cytophaga sp.]|nr:FAD-dependent oxidoreductase [Undibacterium sp.]
MQIYKNSNRPALILGGGVNALGIVRSLGKQDVPLIVMDTDAKSPAMRSRYGRKLLVSTLEGDELIKQLLALARQFTGTLILFVTEEKTVRTVSECREQLKAFFKIRLPQHERLMQLMHKQGFQELAEAISAPIPKTVRLQHPDDLVHAEILSFPCVLKPSEKNYQYGARFKKAYKILSMDELKKWYLEIYPVMADMVVQEWIEGADSDIYFCLQYIGKDGEVVASFPGRKIRSWPIKIGGTASCTAAWEHEKELTATTQAFFNQVGFTGMGSMEYKRDERDGKFHMIEPTVARTDFQEEVATINGVNIPLAAYQYECGLTSLNERVANPPLIWRDPQADRWALEEGGGIIDERSQNYSVRDAYWRWDDPMPWIDLMQSRISQRLTRPSPI